MPGKNKKQSKTAVSRSKTKRTKKKKAAQKRAKSKAVATAVLDSQKLQDLYAAMLRAHLLSRRMRKVLSVGGTGPLPATLGREAVLVGAIAHTLSGDSIAAAQDGFLVSLVRGAPLQSVIEQIAAGNSHPSGAPEQHDAGSPEEIAIKHGMKLAAEQKGKPSVALLFPGEQDAGWSAVHDALNIAARDKLPLVCIAETDSNDAEEQPGRASSASVRSFPQITVDGNDVVAIFRVAQEAVRRARAGHGPSLINCVMPAKDDAHTEDTPATLVFMQQYLERRGLWSEDWQRKVAREFDQLLDAAIAETSNERGHFDQMDESKSSAARLQQGLELA